MLRTVASALQGRLSLASGVVLVLLAAAADAILGPRIVLIPLLAVGPLVAAVRGRLLHVAAVALLALAVAVPLGEVDEIYLESEHIADMVAIALVGALALAVARTRDAVAHTTGLALVEERAARRRAELLSRLTELLDAPLSPETRLSRLAALLVPEVADLAVIDVVGEGSGAVVHAQDARVAGQIRELRRRAPLDRGGTHPAMVVLRTGQPLLLPELPAALLSEWAADADHFTLMRDLGYRSAIVVPMTVAGRVTGVLTALRLQRGQPYDEADLETLVAYADRAAAAVEAARLHAEVRATERRLEAILANVGESVIALGPDGRYAFANPAAAQLFGVPGPDDLVGREPREVRPPFALTDDHGNPVALRNLPGGRAVRGEDPEPMVVRAAYTDGTERWFVVRAAPVRDDDGLLRLVVVVTEDITAVKRAEQRQRVLATASGLMGASLDVQATVEKTVWAVVPDLADWARLDMPDERGDLREVAVAHRDLGKLELLREWRERYPVDPRHPRGPWEVLRTGEPVLWPAVEEADIDAYARDEHHGRLMRAIATRSMLILPLQVGDRVIGSLELATTADSERHLGPEDLELAQELARRAAVAIENARVHEERSQIATILQRSLLPPRLPEVPGVRSAARFRAATGTSEVGGDFYDVFAAGDHWFVVMGDVTGKGPGAAAITSLARWTLRTTALYEERPEEVLARLNEVLLTAGERRELCTAVCARMTPGPAGADLLIACGGHPAPQLVDAAGGVRDAGGSGTILGAFADARFQAEEVRLSPGEVLVLFTDGVTDTRGAQGARFGLDRLRAALGRIGASAPDVVATRLDEELARFQEGPQRDDVALLVLQAAPASGAFGTEPSFRPQDAGISPPAS